MGVAAAIGGAAVVGAVASDRAASKAAKASKSAASTQAQAQMEQLEYLKEREAIPQQFREGALAQLASVYGLGGGYLPEQQAMLDELADLRRQQEAAGVGQRTSGGGLFGGALSGAMSKIDNQRAERIAELERLTADMTPIPNNGQQALIDRAMQSPLYAAMMSGQQAGEESIMRNAAMTGGLRSGNVQSAMYDYNTQLQNQALLQSYNQQLGGLQSMAQLPSNVNQIAGQMGAIGQTQAAGMLAAGQAQQAGLQGVGNAAQTGISQYLQYKALI